MKLPSKTIIISNHVFIRLEFLIENFQCFFESKSHFFSVYFFVCPKQIIRFLNFFFLFFFSFILEFTGFISRLPESIRRDTNGKYSENGELFTWEIIYGKNFSVAVYINSHLFLGLKKKAENFIAKNPEDRELHLAIVVCSVSISIYHS